MSSVVALLRSRYWPRAIAVAAIAIGAAGCSSEATRFNENPFASRGSSNEVTGTVPSSAPVSRVESSSLPPPASRPTTVAAATGTAGGGGGFGSYQPSARPTPTPAPSYTGAVRAPLPQKQASGDHGSWSGGTAVVVKPGENISMIARRHGVSVSAIARANKLGERRTIYPGQRLVIPHDASASRNFANTHAAPRSATPAIASLKGARGHSASGVYIVEPGDTLSRLSRRYGKSISEIARANHIEAYAPLKIGDRLVIPGVRIAKAEHKETHKLAEAKPPRTPAHAKVLPPHKQVASAAPSERANVLTPTSETPPPTTSAVKAEGGPPSFRWPVKGRVIAGFGPKTNGQQNDGINLAVPEGTPVKAAEDGVVAYAGNELKGYGNLVLVRHAHGYVTAYAHASKLLVKRGDHIKRGQVIAKAGQTGNVDAPQLHFEIRKGPSPLDPLPLLRGS